MLTQKIGQRMDFRPPVALTVLFSLLALNAPAEAQVPAPSPGVTEHVRNKVTGLIDEVLESQVELKVTYRRSKIMRMKDDVFRAAVADPSVIEIVAFGSRELEVIGKATGSTTLTLWLGNEHQARVLSILVTVTKDTAVDDLRRLEYGELQAMLNGMFPDSKIQLIPIADKLIVRGQARDEEESVQILSVIRARGAGGAGPQGYGYANGNLASQGPAAEPFPDAVALPESTVISMLTVPGEKQILLKVRIAELKRSAVRQLGSDFNVDISDFFMSSTLAGGGNIITSNTFNNGSFNLVLNALATNGSAKILAEPNLVVLSGKTATFIAGGEFAVPTVVGVGGAQAATTSFKGFGTQLNFTPTVLDRDRVRLKVAPTFSTLNSDNSVDGIFGLDTRAVTTTVDLREGQVLAIAGLLQEQQRGDSKRVPFIGDIPLLNVFFANRSVSRDETELLIVVSPELVHPLEPEDAPTLMPGMEVTEPDDLELFLYGAIEGNPCCHHRSTVWPLYRNRLNRAHKNKKYRQCDSYYINGPYGFSN